MLTFLFWNLGGKPLAESLARLAKRYQVDVLMLAESIIPVAEMLVHLNPTSPAEYHFAPGICEKIVVYTRFPAQFLVPRRESSRLTIRHLVLPAREEMLLAVVHFTSKLHWSNESQMLETVELARWLRQAEEEVGHSRTVLVGDFNMNPFEPGLLAANGLHAVMSRHVAGRGERVVQDNAYPFFYNPMWGHFGDVDATPAGTFYYPHAEHVCYFWNMFDQVLLRPDLLSKFANSDLEIVTTDGEISFLTREGFPDKTRVSDHLPILFRLQM